jgi:hypothetical protein
MALKTKEKSDETAVSIPDDQTRQMVVVDDDYGNDYGSGTDDITPGEVIVPFYRILQSNSPQCDETNPLYDSAARPGMLYNTATNECLDGRVGISIVAVKRDHQFLEYIPRDAGGGFQGAWAPNDPRVAKLRAEQGDYNKLKLESGNELIETFTPGHLDRACGRHDRKRGALLFIHPDQEI